MLALSTFNLAPLLAPVVAALPERHFIAGKGRNARRISTRFKAELTAKDWREVKTPTAAKAHVTRELNKALACE